jgi:putative transposase
VIPDKKRKTRKSWNEPGHSHYLTFSTHHRKPYLKDDRICELLARRINRAAKTQNFAVLAYVFMPDHVHMLIRPLDDIYDMSSILKSAKQGPSCSAKNRGWIDTDHWERGGGYDRNVTNAETREKVIAYIHRNPVKKGLVEESWSYRWSSANWFLNEIDGEINCRRSYEFELD